MGVMIVWFAAVLATQAGNVSQGEFTHKPSAAATFRQQFQEVPRCVPLPKTLFHRLSPPLDRLFSGEVRLSGAGKSLGVLRREKNDLLHLSILRGERVAQEWYLKAPLELEISDLPRFQLSESGEWAVLLRDRKGFAVYAGGELVRTFQDPEQLFPTSVVVMGEDVIWCVTPKQAPKDEEPPALCYQQSLSAAAPEVFLKANVQVWEALIKEAKGKVDLLTLSEIKVFLAPRRDRKFWALGLDTGELFLLNRSGTVAKHWVLPWGIKGVSENQDMLQWGTEHMKAKVAEHMGSKLFDATKPRPKRPAELRVAYSVFSRAYSRENDLVALTHAAADPANALFWIEHDPRDFRCFLLTEFERQLQELTFLKSADVAVTDDR
ncbi:MAG: hypothetical protein ACK42L_06970, partial [Thermoanaerobaculum sp.]